MAPLKKEVDVYRAGSTGTGGDAFGIWRAMAAGFVVVALLAMGLGGCAPTPVEDSDAGERLDTNTGTTVTLMPRPIELVVDRARGPKTDPFAYLAPFETNRMGSRELFLWVSAPQIEGTLGVPEVYCGEELLQLEAVSPDLNVLGLSGPPYKLPAPWSAQWYFKLSGEVLDCLAGAKQVRVITQAGSETSDRFAADGGALSGLADFASRVRT
jgi:hypothetical protein